MGSCFGKKSKSSTENSHADEIFRVEYSGAQECAISLESINLDVEDDEKSSAKDEESTEQKETKKMKSAKKKEAKEVVFSKNLEKELDFRVSRIVEMAGQLQTPEDPSHRRSPSPSRADANPRNWRRSANPRPNPKRLPPRANLILRKHKVMLRYSTF